MVKRIILSLLGLIVVAIIAAVVIVTLYWSRLPEFISSKLSEKMRVQVSIEEINVGWDAIGVNNVSVGNPEGYRLAKAFQTESIDVQAPLPNYLDNPIVIDKVQLDHVYVGIELDSKKSKTGNWTVILGNLEGGEKKPSKGGKKVLIKKLILTDIKIDLAYNKENQVTHLDTIKRLEFNNVSSEEGIPLEQISSIILNQMLKKIFSIENLTDMLQNVIPQGTPGGDALKMIKGFFGSDLEEEYKPD